MNAAPRGSQPPSTAAAGAASRTSATSSTPAAAGTTAAASAPTPASPSRLGRFATSAANVFNTLTSPLRGRVTTVGASPFNGSDANSPLTTNTAAGLSTSGDGDVDNDAIIQEAFEADFYERGDGGDSDEEGAEINAHNDSVAFLNEAEHQQRQEDNIEDEEDFLTDGTTIPGAPPNWNPPKPPDSHKSYIPKPNSDAPPSFEVVDNPGNWCDYFLQPKYNKNGKYVGHTTVAGAKVLPVDPNTGKREIDGWEIHYADWTAGDFEKDTYRRGSATKEDLKPEDRKGSLCVDTLKRYGCTAERVKSDPLWFLHLLLPFCDPSKSGIENDNRMPYFTHVAACTNIYGYTNPSGTDYGHNFKPVNETEMVRFAAVPIRNGSKNGDPGDLHKRFQKTDELFDQPTAASMSYYRFKQIKANFKMSVNTMQPEKGTDGYDPCNKFDYIFKCVVHNMNNVTKKGAKDTTFDESTWGFGGFMGEVGGRLRNKPVDKGGQSVLLVDVYRRYPRAYVHRHSARPRPTGFTAEGHAEMYYLVNELEDLTEGVNPDAVTTVKDIRTGKDVTYKKKKIYSEADGLPHITADNHFNGQEVRKLIGVKGGSLTATLRKDRIPPKVKPHVHHLKLDAGSKGQQSRARVGKYQRPIAAIKKHEASGDNKAFTETLVSFQSTGATNIAGVNNLPSVSFYVSVKGRGRGATRRIWGIEQNEARQVYLGTYHGVDNIDHMIKIAKIRYICWKYWHSPVNHCMSIAVIAAFDMYHECCDGGLDPEWAIPKKQRMSFSKFRQELSKQMLSYNPVLELYPGDQFFRTVTKKRKAERESIRSALTTIKEDEPLADAFLQAKSPAIGFDPPPPRLCGPLNQLQQHLSSFENMSWHQKCEICGNKTYWKCLICDKWMCTLAGRSWNGAECAVRFHNDYFFGLARCDHKYRGLKRDWRPPTDNDITRNVKRVRDIVRNHLNV